MSANSIGRNLPFPFLMNDAKSNKELTAMRIQYDLISPAALMILFSGANQ